MTKITIDGEEYDVETLPEETKAELVSLQFVDSELARLNAQAAALQTARIAYSRAIKETLGKDKAMSENEGGIEGLGHSIEFDT